MRSFLLILTFLSTASAFAPSAFTRQRLPLRASGNEIDAPIAKDTSELDALTLEEEVELLTAKELKKTKTVSNLRNQNGVDYAPWMAISADDEVKIRQLSKEKAEARRKRKEQEAEVQGSLFLDSQAQELSGLGLKYTVVSESEVELEWVTAGEEDTEGFVVRRRKARETEWEVLASYKDWKPLISQSSSGGTYRYTDDSVSLGGWVYRVSEVSPSGVESDLCQALLEVQSQGEKLQGILAVVGFGIIAAGAVFTGITMDPLQ
ncbi:hypothetical protein TrVE_jg7265 [Triparma verrucosa]|uniref:Uncharacterized protein n=2 Tax=Triparma TaxID=722752 RepID=A0A9W7BJF9_9STRA|nr:hypothetical protein TrST_g5332 [Triparma strigata]GMH98877.1 hypothetical protein TrVE_jg7265 [Triparma verrucosa]